MIRVLHVGLCGNLGGIESFVINLYRNIDKTEIQFDFLLDYKIEEFPFENEIKELGGNVYREYYNLHEMKNKNAVSINDFFSNHPEINAVHLHCNFISTTFRVLQIAKKKGINTRILHSHSCGYMHKFSFRKKLYELYVKLILDDYVTDYFACSQEAARWMFGYNKKYKVIPNAINVRKFVFNETLRGKYRDEMNIADEELLLGFVGSFSYQKDPLFLIDIFNEYHNINVNTKLLMLGQGLLKEQVLKKIDEYNLGDFIIMPGNVPNVNEYMQAMDFFVLPSRVEGFGIVLLEAQVAGLQCFTSKGVVPQSVNISGMVEYIERDKGARYWTEIISGCLFKKLDGPLSLIGSKYDIDDLARRMEVIYCEK